MEQLLELSRVIRSLRGNQQEALEEKNNTSKAHQFYAMLMANAFTTDDEAAVHFYGPGADRSLPKYQQLKSRVKQMLLKKLVAVQEGDFSFANLGTALVNCWRAWSAVQVLQHYQAYRAAGELADLVLRYAMKYEFVDLAMSASKLLRQLSTYFGEAKKWDHYNEIAKKYAGAFAVETMIDEYNQALRLQFKSSDKGDAEIARTAWASYRQLEPYLAQYDTNRIQRFGRFIKVMAQLMEHDYERAIQTCQEAIDYFGSKPYFSKGAFLSFYFQQLLCYLNLKDYERGIVAANKALEYAEKGTFNWFKCQESRLMLALHSGRYQEAYAFYLEATGHKRLKKLPAREQESWRLYEAYMYFLLHIQQIKPGPREKRLATFRLGRFLNQVPQYSKSKRGRNIPILVLQLLMFIVQKKYDEAIDRIEALEKYCGRYLRESGSYRSNCFIKMALQIPISGFHKSGVIRRTQAYRKRLEAISINVANRAHEIEIIPYEDLWVIILQALDRKFYWSSRNLQTEKRGE